MADAHAPSDPDHALALQSAGLAAMLDGRNDEAIACFGRLAKIRPDAQTFASLAECCWREDRLEEALRAADAALALDGDHRDALVVRAAALHGQNRFADALSTALQADRRDPASHVARARVGAALERLGRFDEAQQQFGEAARLGPPSKPYAAVSFAGDLYDRLNSSPDQETAEARTVLERSGPGKRRFVVLACCDVVYFRKYGFNFLNSFTKNSAADSLLHLHVVDPDGKFAEMLGMTVDTLDLADITASVSASPPEYRAGVTRNVYYSCCRFLLLPDLLQKYSMPVVCVDIDTIFEGPVAAIADFASRFDLALTPRDSMHAPWLDIDAAGIVANPSDRSASYFGLVRKYLLDFAGREIMPWHLDQVALYCVNRMLQRFATAPRIGWLPRSVSGCLWHIGHNWDRSLEDPRFTRYSLGS